jgi:molybdopterin-containing oxidoreductase family iron-sulfur binding subunit
MSSMSDNKLKLTGKEYWRSLDQLDDSPEFRKFLEQEFPEVAGEAGNGISRRKFLTLMGASAALAGLAGCRRPVEKIIPYVQQPEEIVPGIPTYYATTMPFGSSAYGLVVECHEGRPTKIEGNKLHPSSLGRSNAFMQAEILNLYDPDRSDKVLHNGVESSWDDFVSFWREQLAQFNETNGEGLAILTEPFSSPTLSRLGKDFKKNFPRALFTAYEPVNDQNILEGIYNATGKREWLRPDYHYDKAKVILALDCDFLQIENEAVTAATRFAEGRRITNDHTEMNRLYAVEPDFTTTGAMADHRMRLPRGAIGEFIAKLILALKDLGLKIPFPGVPSEYDQSPLDSKWIATVAKDLYENQGQSLIVGGRFLSALDHQWIFLINAALENPGKTVDYHAPVDTHLSDHDEFTRLIDDMNAGRFDTVVILGGNPVYWGISDLGFAPALKKVRHTVHLASHVDETSRLIEWHLPKAHFLESWGDTRSLDGTAGAIQPMIEPLLGGRSNIEVLNVVISGKDKRGYDLVRETWRNIIEGNFEKGWRRLLHDGVFAGSSHTPANNIGISYPPIVGLGEYVWPHFKDSLELTFQPSPAVYDGRYANNGWLQELPHPTTKLTWDNAACLSPKTAKESNVENGDVVRLSNEHGEVEIPVWIVPGQANYTVSVSFGYGRTSAGRIGDNVGVNTYPLRPKDNSYFASGVKITKTGKTHKLASTQDHGAMEGRPIVREATLDEYRRNPEFAREMVEHPPLAGIYPEHDYSRGYQWGMSIDLNACIGCNACTIACQSENNIPVVGKDRVLEGREMHWIRIDRYFTGETDNPEMVFMPVACQHCENAPCEQVCPVAATSHDSEGLNVMTYNRCIGTRYCSNNCPYKVRRFNFFNYTKDTPEIVRMAMNPDVTVRFRGVMEKCTFCTQRISRAKIKAKQERRDVRDGEITTACQQACPANAIVFGNINDPKSEVAKSRNQKRGYGLLAELNMRPRNTFLARIRNPHPDLKDHVPGSDEL